MLARAPHSECVAIVCSPQSSCICETRGRDQERAEFDRADGWTRVFSRASVPSALQFHQLKWLLCVLAVQDVPRPKHHLCSCGSYSRQNDLTPDRSLKHSRAREIVGHGPYIIYVQWVKFVQRTPRKCSDLICLSMVDLRCPLLPRKSTLQVSNTASPSKRK